MQFTNTLSLRYSTYAVDSLLCLQTNTRFQVINIFSISAKCLDGMRWNLFGLFRFWVMYFFFSYNLFDMMVRAMHAMLWWNTFCKVLFLFLFFLPNASIYKLNTPPPLVWGVFSETFEFFFLLSTHRSKSTSDIHVDPSVMRQLRYQELQKYREQVKESDDKWQDVSITCMYTAH